MYHFCYVFEFVIIKMPLKVITSRHGSGETNLPWNPFVRTTSKE